MRLSHADPRLQTTPYDSVAVSKPSRARNRCGLASHVAVPPVPSDPVLAEMTSQIASLPNVIGCYLGRKIAGGRRLQTPALVVLVRDKLSEHQLAPAERIPPSVTVQMTARVRFTLATDVVISDMFHRAFIATPGDTVDDPAPGTIGVAIVHPKFGAVVTTAGHIYLNPATPVHQEWPPGQEPVVKLMDRETGNTIEGLLHKVVIDSTADYALVAPTNAISRNIYEDTILGGAYFPDANDVGRPCAALAKDGNRSSYFCGVNAPAPFPDGTVLEHAILTDLCTTFGDSGCCLVNEDRKVVGLLVGQSDGQSAFMSIQRLLMNEHAVLG